MPPSMPIFAASNGGCDVRMPRGEALTAECLALRGNGADGDQPLRVAARCSGGRGDESRRVVKPLRLRQPDVAELGPGSLRHLGGDPGENGVDVAPDPRERIGDLHEPGVAHLFHFELRVAMDSAPRRHRARPRLAQRRDISLERGERPRSGVCVGCGDGGCSMLRFCTHPLTFKRARKPAMIRKFPVDNFAGRPAVEDKCRRMPRARALRPGGVRRFR